MVLNTLESIRIIKERERVYFIIQVATYQLMREASKMDFPMAMAL
jgi:hypothetical protein